MQHTERYSKPIDKTEADQWGMVLNISPSLKDPNLVLISKEDVFQAEILWTLKLVS